MCRVTMGQLRVTIGHLRLRMNMKYVTNKAKSENYKMSAVPQMQRLLNKEYQIQVSNFKECIKRSKNF